MLLEVPLVVRPQERVLACSRELRRIEAQPHVGRFAQRQQRLAAILRGPGGAGPVLDEQFQPSLPGLDGIGLKPLRRFLDRRARRRGHWRELDVPGAEFLRKFQRGPQSSPSPSARRQGPPTPSEPQTACGRACFCCEAPSRTGIGSDTFAPQPRRKLIPDLDVSDAQPGQKRRPRTRIGEALRYIIEAGTQGETFLRQPRSFDPAPLHDAVVAVGVVAGRLPGRGAAPRLPPQCRRCTSRHAALPIFPVRITPRSRKTWSRPMKSRCGPGNLFSVMLRFSRLSSRYSR